MTNVLYKKTKPSITLEVLSALYEQDRPQMDKRAVGLPVFGKETEMIDKIAACESCNSLIEGIDGGKSCPACGTPLVIYGALPYAELAQLRAALEEARETIKPYAGRYTGFWGAEFDDDYDGDSLYKHGWARKAAEWLRKYGGLK